MSSSKLNACEICGGPCAKRICVTCYVNPKTYHRYRHQKKIIAPSTLSLPAFSEQVPISHPHAQPPVTPPKCSGIQKVYLLYTNIEGIFYVGSGNKYRLSTTINAAFWTLRNGNYTENSLKYIYIRACRRRMVEVEIEVIASFDKKENALSLERSLIRMWGPILTNVTDNPCPMRELPSFLPKEQLCNK